jgi:hypothetical protein
MSVPPRSQALFRWGGISEENAYLNGCKEFALLQQPLNYTRHWAIVPQGGPGQRSKAWQFLPFTTYG